MKKQVISVILAAVMLLACTIPALGDDSSAGVPVDPWVYQGLLGRGMDVDWCKTPQGQETYRRQAAEDFRAAGLSHVRIRLRDSADEALLSQLDRQIDDCLAVGLIPVIAYQADELKNDPSPKQIQKVADWWRTVAARYRDKSYLLSFDLIIEVTDALNDKPETLNDIYEHLVSAIRETNPRRIVMISPRLRSDAACLTDLKLPSQANGFLMAEWHFYAAGPSKTNERKLWTTGTAAERQLVQEKIDLALAWQKSTGVPTWVGAWMPGNYNDGDDYTISEQSAFAAFLSGALDGAGIPFAVNADTHFYDRETNHWIGKMQPVFAAFCAPLPFADVSPAAWYSGAAAYVYRRGLISGVTPSAFAPEETLSRQQLWTILGRMSGQELSGVYAAARSWAMASGVSDGANPTGAVTREQFAAALWRCAGSPATDTALEGFCDGETVSAYAREAMAWAVQRGILEGSDGRLLPGEPTTRAQAAAILQRSGGI